MATSNEAVTEASRSRDDDGDMASQTGAPGRGAGGADRGDPVFPAHIAGVTPQTTAVANVAGIDSGVHRVDTGGISDHVVARRHLHGPSLARCPRHIVPRRLARFARPGLLKTRTPIMGGLRPRCPRPRPHPPRQCPRQRPVRVRAAPARPQPPGRRLPNRRRSRSRTLCNTATAGERPQNREVRRPGGSADRTPHRTSRSTPSSLARFTSIAGAVHLRVAPRDAVGPRSRHDAACGTRPAAVACGVNDSGSAEEGS